MSVLTFKGGVHPFSGKAFTKNKAIDEYYPEDGLFVIPMCQHIGAPAKPIVKVGDRVLVNQKIGEAEGMVSANIHSSVSGIVKEISKRRIANGSRVQCVIIENDSLYEKAEAKENEAYMGLPAEKKIALIKEAGIVGMGGAGFPTHVKLSPKNPEKIDYIIVNGAECEPYLTSDYRRMLENPELIVEGLRIVLSIFENAKGIIAVEDNKLDAVKRLKRCISPKDNIEVKTLFTKYPQGGERSLIYAVTGRCVDSTKLPADVGCIVNNIDTVYAIYNAVAKNIPLTERVVTITGDAVKYPGNYIVPIGVSIEKFIEDTGEFKKTPEKIISGGPMMGMALYDLDIPVVKGTSAILMFEKDEVAVLKPQNCINCGRCAEVCPSGIIPSRLAKAADNRNEDEFIKLYGLECVECGSCSYICPAKRQITQSIKAMKKKILLKK